MSLEEQIPLDACCVAPTSCLGPTVPGTDSGLAGGIASKAREVAFLSCFCFTLSCSPRHDDPTWVQLAGRNLVPAEIVLLGKNGNEQCVSPHREQAGLSRLSGRQSRNWWDFQGGKGDRCLTGYLGSST